MKWRDTLGEVIEDLNEEAVVKSSDLVDRVIDRSPIRVRTADLPRAKKSIRTLLARDRRIEKVSHGWYRKKAW